MPHHVLGHRCLRDFNAEHEQLAMNPWRTPAWICQTHAADQVPHVVRDPGPTVSHTALPCPVEPKPLAMPGNHGFWSHNQQGRTPTRPESRKPNPESPVPDMQADPTFSARWLQHEELMMQGQALGMELSA